MIAACSAGDGDLGGAAARWPLRTGRLPPSWPSLRHCDDRPRQHHPEHHGEELVHARR